MNQSEKPTRLPKPGDRVRWIGKDDSRFYGAEATWIYEVTTDYFYPNAKKICTGPTVKDVHWPPGLGYGKGLPGQYWDCRNMGVTWEIVIEPGVNEFGLVSP